VSAPAGWPFETGALVVYRPCGCCWMRAGMGVVIFPCVTHAEPLAAAVRREDEQAQSPADPVASMRTEPEEIAHRILAQTMRMVGPERFSPERHDRLFYFLLELFKDATGFSALPPSEGI